MKNLNTIFLSICLCMHTYGVTFLHPCDRINLGREYGSTHECVTVEELNRIEELTPDDLITYKCAMSDPIVLRQPSKTEVIQSYAKKLGSAIVKSICCQAHRTEPGTQLEGCVNNAVFVCTIIPLLVVGFVGVCVVRSQLS